MLSIMYWSSHSCWTVRLWRALMRFRPRMIRSAGKEKSSLMPNPSRWKWLNAFNCRNTLPSSRLSALKSIGQVRFGAPDSARVSGLSRFSPLRGLMREFSTSSQQIQKKPFQVPNVQETQADPTGFAGVRHHDQQVGNLLVIDAQLRAIMIAGLAEPCGLGKRPQSLNHAAPLHTRPPAHRFQPAAGSL